MKLDKTLKNVLYQKLGNDWYVFSELDNGEVIYTALPKDFDPKKKESELIYISKDGDQKAEPSKSKPKRNLESSL